MWVRSALEATDLWGELDEDAPRGAAIPLVGVRDAAHDVAKRGSEHVFVAVSINTSYAFAAWCSNMGNHIRNGGLRIELFADFYTALGRYRLRRRNAMR